jgi:Tol biopolymer transport system component
MTRLSILVLACALAVPAAAHATFPGSTGRIALDLHGKNLDEAGQATYRSITTLRSTSKGDRFVRECQVTGSGVKMGDCSIDYFSPAWSPSGRKLAFDAGRSLGVMNADGSGFRLLARFTSGDGEPAWSKSGRQLAFTGEGGIWVANPTTRTFKRIVRRGSGPDWSSRNLIAFERGGSVFSVKPSGRGLRKIARGKDPGWAANGRSLVLARRGGIYTLRADGTKLRRIVRCTRCSTPVLSPDGRLVAYDQAGVKVAFVSTGKLKATLIKDFSAGATDSADASNPAWQAR